MLNLGQLVPLWGHPVGVTPEGLAAVLAQALGPVCTDSRRLEAGALFVPLVGEQFDGHAFLANAAELGAQAALVAADASYPVPAGLLHWRVDDTTIAYQQLATLHRRQLRAAVVAVTGSAGKTTTRELIRAALVPLGSVQASASNNNNDIGVPLTLLGTDPGHAAVVVEMGMRGPGEIERLSRCAEPDIAVITNIGTAHIGRLGSREAIAAAKCEITASLKPDGLVVIPAGDPLLEAALAAVWSGRVHRVGLAGETSATGVDDLAVLDETSQFLTLDRHRYRMPLAGRHNARNWLLARAVADALGVDAAKLADLVVEVPGGRNRRLSLGGLTVLDETYNASPEAVLAALDLLAEQPGRRFAVLGTMLELGSESVPLHRAVVERARLLGLDGLVAVASGAEAAAMVEAAAGMENFAIVEAPEQAAVPLGTWLRSGDCLLLKASRGVALERLLPALESLAL
ncbi:UDP-N-acetylmuramoyl-tripeptide--D-alanyl-D-alanine ligase [Synechococcus sp. MIT S9451]|uniref:UDP-N-acetylmuramoyl-tripeptide--D-alanyl-D- alanine ligase n=1 Tax=Synechococcus sp. MIT S9451 TaxID=3082543 RepID=UPI0039B67A71